MASDRTWDAVPYAPDLSTGVLALHRRTWPDAEIADPAFLRWMYDDNPAGQALSTFARERSSGELIAQFGAVPVRLWVDGEERLAAIGLNVSTDEAYRRQGIFTALGRAADERMAQAGAGLAFAMPNANSFPGFVGYLGYTHAGDIPFLVRPVNVRRLVASRLPLPLVPALAAVLSRPFVPPLPGGAAPAADVAVSAVEDIDERFDTFWHAARGRQPVMMVRDRAYLDWRFRRIPLRRYELLCASRGDLLAGYIVLRVTELLGLRAGLVVDFLVEPSPAGERAGSALLAHALAYFADKDLDLLATLMLSHAPEFRLLRRAGFRPLPGPLLPQRFRLVARDGHLVRDARNWFFTMGDYDVV